MNSQNNQNQSHRSSSLKKFAMLVAVVLAMCIFASCGTQEKKDNTSNQFRVGMECGYSPFNWTQLDDSNGAVPIQGTNQFANGYDVQIAQKIADSLGRELVIVKTAWNGLQPSLSSGKIDAIIAGMSATEERKQSIDFSDNYYYSDLVVVVQKEGPYANATALQDFSGAKITGQQGTLHYDVIDQIEEVQKQTALEDFPNMIIALLSGTIDGYVSERPGALGAVAANPALTFVDFPAGEGFIFDDAEVSIGVGVKIGDPIKEEINQALAGISDEEREQIMTTAIQTQPMEEMEEAGLSTVSEEKEVFRVGMECGYSPFNWTQLDDSNGAVPIQGTNQFANGYDVQIGKRIAEQLGKELVVVKTAWSGLQPSLSSGKIDAIIAGMSATEERKEAIDFSDNYYYSDLVLVVKKDGPYANATALQDFSGAKITGQQGTLHYDVIDQIEGVQKQTALEDFPNMIIALLSGTIDGYVSERPGALGAVTANPDLVFVDFPPGEGFIFDDAEVSIGVGVTIGNPIREEINAALATISEEEREQIMTDAIKNQPMEEEVSDEIIAGTPTENLQPTETPKEAKTFGQSIVSIWQRYWKHFLQGAGTTLFIALIGTIVGLAIGLLVASIRIYPMSRRAVPRVLQKLLNFILSAYVEIIRGTPMMVQAMLFYYGLASLFDINMTPLFAGLVIVSFNTGAYMAEVVRGGIESIDDGQLEACKAIGMTHGQSMRSVILPQAIRNILPATGNEFVINIKDTSVLNVISVTELYFATKDVQANTLKIFESYLITAAIYFVLTFTVTRILRAVERKMDGPTNYALTSSTTVDTVKMHQKQGR